MRRRTHINKLAFRQLAGWCGLLLYVGTLSPIGMGVGTLLGTMDPDHHAILQPTADGIRLVLRHEGECSGHQHHAVARVLTLFASPISAVNPDHVLQFSSASSFMRDSQSVVLPSLQNEFSIVHFPAPDFFGALSLVQPIRQIPPPPDRAGQLRCLRATVLLI